MHAPSDHYRAATLDLEGDAAVSKRPSSHAPHGPKRPSAPPKGGHGRLILILVAVLALMVIGGVFGLLPRLWNRSQVAKEGQQLSVSTVTVVSPAPSKLAEPLVLSGEMRALVEAPLYARATGYVRRWLVDLGAHVEAGQLLAELETPEIDRELSGARAELKQAEATRDLAQVTAKRWVQMLSNRTVSPQEAEEKQGDFATKLAAAEAAAARVEQLQETTGFSRIVAPFAGTVTARRLDIGQLVSAGAGQELFRISQTEKLRVFVRVPQSYARSVLEGQKAELTLAELPGRKFEAKVVRSAGAIEIASRTLLAELEVDNAKGELLAGSYAQVRLVDSRPEASLTIPANCLLFRAEGPQIGVVDATNHATLKTITMGRDFGTTIEILAGVEAKDRIILNPPDALVSGTEVRVSEPGK